ncbi:Smr protein/MutS2 [Spirochaeta thermophila DSM 6578]|uniref:Smr protein/MutS2 n=1 Tax=Winmispira thermophila (strain ATCC 700085 / DSM 6578 / Z-1203) TaxID=869211 RepID=G0GBY3_WINT7|nr:Smr/MutS family protein [Spirochaeta thermophila]AEJ61994.1 Smr protein/MutS2 [Spirochaeta thermophila DSM 6578]
MAESFGDILREWEERERKTGGDLLHRYLDRYLPDERVVKEKKGGERRSPDSRSRKRPSTPQAVLDLHGFTREEAEIRLKAFLGEAQGKGYRVLLIVHGKGLHSEREPILKKVVYRTLESCPFVGRIETAPRRWGGAGAVVAFLRQRSR